MAQNRGQKRKVEVGKSKPPTLKDVILLPSPTIKEVPRGWKREELYDKNFAVSAVEISEDMDECQIREKLNDVFCEKFLHIPEPKFEFVRSVGKKIPGCQSYNGKVVKHLSRQGPLYVRSTQDIATGMDIFKPHPKDESDTVLDDNEEENDEENDEEMKMDSDDDILMTSPFYSTICQPSHTAYNHLPTSSPTAESSLTVTYSLPGHNLNSSTTALRDTINERQECVITAVMVTCPTCNNCFSTEEIAEHADLCAEAPSGGLQSGVTYRNLVMQDMNTLPLDMDTDTKNKDITLKECLETLKANVQVKESRLYVRRKLLWQDFVNVTKSCKWFQPTNTLKIIFVGEPAVDGGGPKREFFTGTV